MKKISILCIASILTLLMTGCPLVTPGLLYITLLEVPEWIDEISASDTFTPDENIQEYFDVSYMEADSLKKRKNSDEDGEFVYVSVTAPPINFSYAYKDKR
ncbi:MAG: hypothetical protein J5930_04925 [Treponema sp.]|nr:hypothetical protein [Treponema sp.]